MIRGTYCYVRDITSLVLGLLKVPIAFLLAATLLVSVVFSSITSIPNLGLSMDICRVPLLSAVVRCGPTESLYEARHVDFPSLMALQHRTLDELAAHSAVGPDLVLSLKHAELVIQDLVVMVRTSNLTSRDVLADALVGFQHEARRTGRRLHSLTAKIHSAMDR